MDLNSLSTVIGFLYTLLWSLSFYPQAILNKQRKSVKGLSLDFVYLNTLGFLCYFIYNIFFYFDKVSINQYLSRTGQNPSIHSNDIIFSLHALILSVIVLIQCQIYPSETRQKLVLFKSYLSLAILGSIITTALVYAKLLEFIDFLYFLSLVKIGVTLLKYLPQLVLNYTTKSTVGWSIENIILDLGGGMLSIVQMIIDAFILNSWTPFIGNPVKFGLGLSSIIFDGMFIIQHYFLSYDNDEEQVDLERAPLLPMASSTESLHSSFV